MTTNSRSPECESVRRRSISTRRDFLSFATAGIGATALCHLLGRERYAAAETAPAATAGRPHFAPKATRAIHINLIGGLSHLDSFDYKPDLEKFHGQKLPSSERPDTFFNQVGLLRKADWEFRQRGKSGLWVSEMFPHLAAHADELTVVRSLHAESANHTPALYVENSGFLFGGFPSMGSWISYGLGSEAEDLPAYVVLPDARGLPNGGASIWSSGFLPAQHQGVLLGSGESPVRALFPSRPIGKETEAATREFIGQLDAMHRERLGDDPALSARMRSYELAARMQLSVPELSDLSRESAATRERYGLDQAPTADFARSCLLSRRLLEKGVRFVQLFSGGPIAGSPRASWDAHENVKENHTLEAGRIDRPIAGLLADLKERGLLADTLVIFTTEFGRTPFAQSGADQVGPGRDHNRYGFSCWLAGAGLKAGTAFGATDDIGWEAVERPVAWYDLHATILHLLGIDHERLTFYHNGIQRRLTNVHGEVMQEILA